VDNEAAIGERVATALESDPGYRAQVSAALIEAARPHVLFDLGFGEGDQPEDRLDDLTIDEVHVADVDPEELATISDRPSETGRVRLPLEAIGVATVSYEWEGERREGERRSITLAFLADFDSALAVHDPVSLGVDAAQEDD
jgi:hypothetical protein